MKNRLKKILLLTTVICVFISCGGQKEEKMQKFTLNGRTQGTYYHIVYYNFTDEVAKKRNLPTESQIKAGIDSILNAIDASLSLWNPQSILSKVNRNETVLLDKIFIENFEASQNYSKLTDGYFDVTVCPLVQAYGFGNEKKQMPDAQQTDSIMQFVGFEKVRLNGNKIEKDFPQTRLDFNAIAQGYTADKVSEYFKSLNINSHIVDIGGEVFAADKKPDGQKWRVAIEEPSDSLDAPREYNSFIKLENQAVVTSGNYRKYIIENGVKYSHSIDPKSGRPAKHSLLSVSVVAESATSADAIATALMVMGLEKAQEFINDNPQYGAVFIFCDSNGKTKTLVSENLKDSIETLE